MLITQLHMKKYTEFNDGYQLVLPLSLEGLIPEDDSVQLLGHILEEIDYTLKIKRTTRTEGHERKCPYFLPTKKGRAAS